MQTINESNSSSFSKYNSKEKVTDQEVGLGFHHVNGDRDTGTVMVDVQTIILHEG